jgi:hypothetical protein
MRNRRLAIAGVALVSPVTVEAPPASQVVEMP